MKNIKILIDKLQAVGDTQVVRNKELHPYPADIDMYADVDDANSLIDILEDSNMVITLASESKLQAKGYMTSRFYIVDILFDGQYITELFCDVNVTDELESEIKQDTAKGRFLRYVYMLRREPKYIKFVDSYYQEYKTDLTGSVYISNDIFKSLPSRRQLTLVMLRQPLALLRHIGLRHMLCMLSHRCSNMWSKLGSGRIYAIVGPDGSGKTTLVDKLLMFANIETMYMGDKDFLLQPLYSYCLERGWKLFGLIFVPMYIEQWLRYLHARALNLIGRDVIVDRYAGLNGVTTSGRAYRVLYSIFPQADKYILLKVPADTVTKRKAGLDVKQVEATYQALAQAIPEDRLYIVDNQDIDTCSNTVAGVIFSDLE